MAQRSVSKWMNRMMKWMLRSPFHSSVSQSIMLISFNGRKTGKRYTTPIRYLRTNDKVIAFTREAWWKNLEGQAPVELRIAGQDVRGIPTPINGQQATIHKALYRFLSMFPSDAKYYAVALDAAGKPLDADVAQAAQDTILLEIQLQAN